MSIIPCLYKSSRTAFLSAFAPFHCWKGALACTFLRQVKGNISGEKKKKTLQEDLSERFWITYFHAIHIHVLDIVPISLSHHIPEVARHCLFTNFSIYLGYHADTSVDDPEGSCFPDKVWECLSTENRNKGLSATCTGPGGKHVCCWGLLQSWIPAMSRAAPTSLSN